VLRAQQRCETSTGLNLVTIRLLIDQIHI